MRYLQARGWYMAMQRGSSILNLAPKAEPLSASRKLKEVGESGDEAERNSGRNWAVSASWSSQAAPQRLQADLSSW